MAQPAADLRAEIVALFATPIDEPLSESAFDRHARASFELQFEYNAPFARYAQRRGITPQSLTHWTEIPAVPTAAFKEVPLVVGSPGDAEALFRTSGTTRGAEKRGTHYVRDLSLYHGALLPMFEAYLLPDAARLPFVSLIPDLQAAPDSSLSHMTAIVAERFAETSTWVMDPVKGLDETALEQYLAQNRSVLLLGTSFAFVHWLDSLAARGVRFRLPAGSRLMDTGGYKGKSRSVPAQELRAAYQDRLGIPASHCVNEYGMTELCSQFYDRTLRKTVLPDGRDAQLRQPAPWVRTRVVHPETLAPVPQGTVGILQHFDLANLYSVTAVQTEDLGREVDGGFELLGRAQGAAPRGCSIAMDMLLQANRAAR